MKPGILIVPVMLSAILGGCLSDSSDARAPATPVPTDTRITETATVETRPVFGITSMPPPFADRTPEIFEDCDPDLPIEIDEDSDRAPPGPPEELAAWGELVLIAHVIEVLPSRWTTPDGSRPEPCLMFAPFGYWLGTPNVEIVTPVVVEYDGSFIGGDFELIRSFFISEINPGEQLVLIDDGDEIDGDIFTNDTYGHSPYNVGDQIVLSLRAFRAIPYRTLGYGVPWHRALGTAWIPVMKWTVQPDGSAVAD